MQTTVEVPFINRAVEGIKSVDMTSTAERKLLDPSELGTKDYWEAAYDREIRNHAESADDEGIVWFDDTGAEEKTLELLDAFGDTEQRALLSRQNCRFLDLGTGNGHMLFALREYENEDGTRWLGEMVGVDYSPRSIQLARQIDGQRRAALIDEADGDAEIQIDEQFAKLRFDTWDLLGATPGDWLQEGFDVVLDKGTFDAISLMSPQGEGVQNPCDKYRESVLPLIKAGSYLIITSCNWTRAELIDWLAPQGGELSLFTEAKYPTYTFGGHTGQSVVTLVFCKT